MNTNSQESQYYFLQYFKSQSASLQNQFLSNFEELDIKEFRKDFPILEQRINNKPLVWLDNAATTQKPQCVMDTLNTYYREYNSNVHRGAHTLAKKATNAFDEAREKITTFIGAKSQEEIIFVRGATEGINLLAQSFGAANINAGDEIILTTMEHHSNIVPWQSLAKAKGATLKIVPINSHGDVILEEYKKLFSHKTRLVAMAHVSNVLGTVNPVRTMIEIAHREGVFVLVDGAQSVPHIKVNVTELDADFYVFSGHKCYGPTGIGVLYGKKALLSQMEPWQRGGGMIKNVTFKETEYNGLPHKFEAGTGNIADAIGLGAAIDYMSKIGMERIEQHEKHLTQYAMESLAEVPGISLIGTSPNKISVVSFNIKDIEPQRAAHLLNQEGIAVRGGHHCAQPALSHFGFQSSIRASLGLYNTREEIDYFVKAVRKIERYM